MDKIFFKFGNIATDDITAINGQSIGTPLSVKDFVVDNNYWGDWWVEKTIRGELVLVTNCEDLESKTITADNGTPYVISAQSNFIKGRPNDR